MLPHRACEFCGEMFTPAKRIRRFCSAACANGAQARYWESRPARELPESKTCAKCLTVSETPAATFQRDRASANGLQSHCRDCRNDARRLLNGDRTVNHQQYLARQKFRLTVLRRYGGDPPRCACCSESEVKFLAIDHIDGGGKAHRGAVGGSSDAVYRWLRRNGFPEGYRVLCHNCNMARAFYGECPHQGNIGGAAVDTQHAVPTSPRL
jgi:hypothetical protein